MSEREFRVIENEWIRLKDGTELAARIWMPAGTEADPVPAVLEYLPYRKQGGTSLRDESTYPVFAAAGIAGVRVDIRGSGESEGVIDGEYTPRELSDGCEIIEWIAAQP
ncbi:MAG: CocE/NonD family hydrolase, partial [Ensifer adhaerens]|nr:CocE/NonD family hydrolase [Ensifer adhaerens]